MKKRLLASFLSIVMILGMLPMTVLAADSNVAEVNGKQYADLQAAINEATDSSTVTLLADINATNTITFDDSIKYTLDLAGKKLTIHTVETDGMVVSNSSTLTVVSSTEAAGTIQFSSNKNGSDAIQVSSNSTLNLEKNVTLSGSPMSNNLICADTADGQGTSEINLNGANIVSTGETNHDHAPIVLERNSTFNMNSGSITINAGNTDADEINIGAVLLYPYVGRANLKGGTITVDGNNAKLTSIILSYYNGKTDGYAVLDGTEFSINSKNNGEGYVFLNDMAGTHVALKVNKGSFTGNLKEFDTYIGFEGAGWNYTRECEVDVFGGRFPIEVPEKYCADDYKPTSSTDGEGNTVYSVQKVAKGEVSRGMYSTPNNRIQGAVMKANPEESVVLELYSGETKLGTTTLTNKNYLANAATELTWSFCISDTSSSWKTVWEKGHPHKDFKPDKVVLYIDGVMVDDNTVTLHKDNSDMVGEEADWATLDGVIKVGNSAYVSNNNGVVTIWGEATNADPVSNLHLDILDEEGNVMGTVVLNDVEGIYAATTTDLTWHAMVIGDEYDAYWTTTWDEGYPNAAAEPKSVKLYIDGKLVHTAPVHMSGADDLNPVVWHELFEDSMCNEIDSAADDVKTAIDALEYLSAEEKAAQKAAVDAAAEAAKDAITAAESGEAMIKAQEDGFTAFDGIVADAEKKNDANKPSSRPSRPSSSTPARYAITVEDADNGDVTVSHKSASKGSTVTITVTPDEGYELDTLVVLDKNGDEIDVKEKADGKFTFKMPAGKVTVEAEFALAEVEPTWDNPFIDVDEDDWFYTAVAYVEENGLMSGMTTNSFGPNAYLTRAMLAQVLYNLDEDAAPGAPAVFTDVNGEWFADAVNWAFEMKIVSGLGNGQFGPNNNITREQLATILYNYANQKGYIVTGGKDIDSFPDADETSAWAVGTMEWAVGNGLISGRTNGDLDPQGFAKRAEIASVLMNFCEKIIK